MRTGRDLTIVSPVNRNCTKTNRSIQKSSPLRADTRLSGRPEKAGWRPILAWTDNRRRPIAVHVLRAAGCQIASGLILHHLCGAGTMRWAGRAHETVGPLAPRMGGYSNEYEIVGHVDSSGNHRNG